MSKNVTKINPVILKEMLDSKVIGQDIAKKQLCMAIDSQIKKMENPDFKSTKKNLLLIGKKGSGKSEILKVISKIDLPVPVVIIDALTLFKSKNILETIAKETIIKANYNSQLAEHSIVIIENLDGALTDNPQNYLIDKEGMEFINKLEFLLKGYTKALFKIGDTDKEKEFKFNNMMIMIATSVQQIEYIVKLRLGSNKIGFLRQSYSNDMYSKIQTEDLINIGFPSSFIGLFDSIIKFRERNKKEFVNVIVKSDLVADCTARLKEIGKELVVTETASNELAKYSLENNLGLWSIKNMIESKLTIVEFDAQTQEYDKIIVDTFLDS